MTECQDCHNDYKNLAVHKRFCKAKKSPSSDPAGDFLKDQATIISPSEPLYPSINPADDPYSPGIKGFTKEYLDGKKIFLNKVLHHNTSKKETTNPPIIIKNPDPTFRQDEKSSESDKLKRFLADAPLWTKYKPSRTTAFMAKALNPGKVYAPMVMVGENEPPQVLYMPYEPERNRFILPGKGYYITPTTGLPFFFHKDYMLPLVNAPNLKDRFQLPGHIVESVRAAALNEGLLQASDKFLDEMRKNKYITYGAIAVALVALFVAGYMAYTAEKSINNLAAQVTNMTEVIKAGRGVVLK